MIILVKVKLNSKKQELVEEKGGYLAFLVEPPEKNKANIELLNLLSKHFRIASKNIKIKRGLKSRNKIIEIKEGISHDIFGEIAKKNKRVS